MTRPIRELIQLLEEYVPEIIANGNEIIDALEQKGIKVNNSAVYYGGDTLTLFFDKGLKVSISKKYNSATYELEKYIVENNKTEGSINIPITEISLDKVITAIETLYNEGLEKKPSKDKQIELETNFNNGVEVSSGSTGFVRLKFIKPLDNKEVESNFKKLLKLCRENKITVKGRKNAETQLAVYPEYLRGVETYNKGVAELQTIWKTIVDEGIFMGCNDDKRINDAHEKRFALEKLCYGNSPISRYRRIAKDIQEKLDDIEYQIAHPDSYRHTTMIGF